MTSFIRRFLSKPNSVTTAFQSFKNLYGAVDAVAGTSKVVYTVATLGPMAAAAAAWKTFKYQSDSALLEERVKKLEDMMNRISIREALVGGRFFFFLFFSFLFVDSLFWVQFAEKVMKQEEEMKRGPLLEQKLMDKTTQGKKD